jgi:tRNA (cmo5U34)-methyltransferase
MNQSWTEESSETFIDMGRYFVPDREIQIQTICDLVPPFTHSFNILEICCGEGLLAEAMLKTHTHATVYGYDGSQEMRQTAQHKLQSYGSRFHTQDFDLFDTAWRKTPFPVHAIVSSLTIHHLDAQQKQALYQDLYHLLEPQGVLLIADLIQPKHPLGVVYAGNTWDQAVQERAQKHDGNQKAFEQFQHLKWNYYHHPDPADKPSPLFDQLQWLQNAGFKSVDVYWMRAGHAIFGGHK